MPSDGVPQIQIGWLAEVVRRLNQCRKAIAGYSPKVALCFPEIRKGNPRSWADDVTRLGKGCRRLAQGAVCEPIMRARSYYFTSEFLKSAISIKSREGSKAILGMCR